MERVRSIVTHCLNPVTDWGGTKLDPDIFNHLQIGNTVRICISDIADVYHQTVYVKIIKHIEKDIYRGVVNDPYYGHLDWFLRQNGDECVFSTRNISEIPVEKWWKGNNNLCKHVKYLKK